VVKQNKQKKMAPEHKVGNEWLKEKIKESGGRIERQASY